MVECDDEVEHLPVQVIILVVMVYQMEFVILSVEKVLLPVLLIVDLRHFHDIMKRVMMERIVWMVPHVRKTQTVWMEARVSLVMVTDVVRFVPWSIVEMD